MLLDGYDVQYLLLKKNITFTDIARELDVTPQNIFMVVKGGRKSQRVLRHIEKLLGIAPETLEITNEKREALFEVA